LDFHLDGDQGGKKKKKRRRKERVSFTSKLWSLVMEKSSQVIKVEENVYKKKMY
jgi:hypothetical protein